MRYRIAALTLGFVALTAACTTANGTPATAPSVPEALATTAAPPPTTTPVVVTTEITTTTVDRLSEIQAIYEDLEHRRVNALWSADADSFVSLFVDNAYREESLRALDFVEPGDPPDLIIDIIRIIKDDPGCLVFVERTAIAASENPPTEQTVTLQPTQDGWGYAYVSDGPGGWLCTDPHPLSG
jgi:hypothetical protein